MDPVQKLEQFGYASPQNTDDQITGHANQILKQIAAQYEQTKDVLWCCLDQPILPNGQKLDPADAFHAVTSEIHGLLVQTSQMHKLYLSSCIEQRQINETLSQQLEQLKRTDPAETGREELTQQLEQIKQTYIDEISQLKKQVEGLQLNLQQQSRMNVELEKENLILKTEQNEKPVVLEDDLCARRLIFQREQLNQQVKALDDQKSELDSQIQVYNKLIEVTKGQLVQQGADSEVLKQLTQVTSNLSKLCIEVDRLNLEKEDIAQENRHLKELYEKDKMSWLQQKQDMKKEWKDIFQQVCQQIGFVM